MHNFQITWITTPCFVNLYIGWKVLHLNLVIATSQLLNIASSQPLSSELNWIQPLEIKIKSFGIKEPSTYILNYIWGFN